MSREFRVAFTLRDLMLAVAVIAVVLAIAAPFVEQAREQARQAQCKNNLQQLGLAMHGYHDTHGVFPCGMVDDDHDAAGAMHTGFLLLLPFMQEAKLYHSYNFQVGPPPGDGAATRNTDPPTHASANWFHLANSTTIGRELTMFICPSNRCGGSVPLGSTRLRAGATDYGLANGAVPLLCGSAKELSYPARLGGFFGVNSAVRIKDVRDGTSLTVAMGEAAGGEQHIGTMNTTTAATTAADALGSNPRDPRPWGIDQAWGVARISPSVAGGFPRGSIFISAYQHIGSDLKIDGNSQTELFAPMNPRLVMASRAGSAAKTTANADGTAGPCWNGTAGDRLSNVRSGHHGGGNFLMGDGTVRFITNAIDSRVYGFVFTIQGAEICD